MKSSKNTGKDSVRSVKSVSGTADDKMKWGSFFRKKQTGTSNAEGEIAKSAVSAQIQEESNDFKTLSVWPLP